MSNELSDDILIDGFISALEGVPDTHAHISSREVDLGPGRADFIVEARIGGQPIRFLVGAKRTAFPRDVREAIWQLRNYLAHMPNDGAQIIPMMIADTISPGAKSLLRDEKLGYYDTSGSLYAPAHGAFLFIDKPIPKRQARSTNVLFMGRRAQVLHAIWVHQEDWFGVHEIAKRAMVSPATASETLIALERREWVVARGSGPAKERRLSDRSSLLDAWAAYQTSTKPPPLRHYFVRAPKIADLIRRLDHAAAERDMLYAITGGAAGQAYAPYLSTISQLHCRFPIGPGAEAVLQSIDARPVREGWNLGVIDSRSSGDFAFRERVNDAWFADPLQAYLDLLQAGGRSKELAEHLRTERLST